MFNKLAHIVSRCNMFSSCRSDNFWTFTKCIDFLFWNFFWRNVTIMSCPGSRRLESFGFCGLLSLSHCIRPQTFVMVMLSVCSTAGSSLGLGDSLVSRMNEDIPHIQTLQQHTGELHTCSLEHGAAHLNLLNPVRAGWFGKPMPNFILRCMARHWCISIDKIRLCTSYMHPGLKHCDIMARLFSLLLKINT